MEQKYIDGEWVTVDDLLEKHTGFIKEKINPLKKTAFLIGMTKEDLFISGAMGLTEAFKKFDSDKGVKFLSFAGPYIQGYMMNEIAKHNFLVRVPSHIYWLMTKIRQCELEEEEPEKVAKKLDAPIEHVTSALETMKTRIKSTNQKAEIDSDDTLEDILTSTPYDETEIYVNEFKDRLNEIENRVLSLKMDGYTDRDIGKIFNKSRGYTGFIMKKVRKKYQQYAR
ncbi:sigma-70 family RNA polymerase sigma factor [Gracilibacillus thailandensis]|uniref:Sigma-70 family RNA polymerase sigma factor n=2 Tax=Gracilibacillus thailandensis TaxID=563735 RepID=A0A6N7QSP2_9BACI|nr:hypothetical protein [Gracilibacillus thailandensis]MRI65137.1 hypothetical protein [Gracilibacillus thailandensis]